MRFAADGSERQLMADYAPAAAAVGPVALATIIDGKAVAARIRAAGRRGGGAVRRGARARRPGLATVLVGDDPASQIYVAGKHRACEEVGIASVGRELPADTSQEELLAVVGELNADPAVTASSSSFRCRRTWTARGRRRPSTRRRTWTASRPRTRGCWSRAATGSCPATPSGVMELLRAYDTPLEGAHAVVVGRSDLVGKPVASLLLAENATVTVCHSRTRDLAAVCRSADVLVAAVGRPRLVTGEMVREGATVIDVGMNRTDEGLVGRRRLRGRGGERARAITPVPGRRGPDDDRDAAPQHAQGGASAPASNSRPRGPARCGPADIGPFAIGRAPKRRLTWT